MKIADEVNAVIKSYPVYFRITHPILQYTNYDSVLAINILTHNSTVQTYNDSTKQK